MQPLVQVQPPSFSDIFDEKQVRNQALSDINLLLETCKSQKTALSIRLDFKPEHKAQTLQIYQEVIARQNELLKNEKSPVIVSLQSAESGWFVVAQYDDFKENVKVSQDKLVSMKPLELTKEQWEALKEQFQLVAKRTFDRSFDLLFPSQKMEVVRKVISPNEKEGKEFGFEYVAGGNIKMASETLSSLKGDCDDYSLLYIACLKKLEQEGTLKVEGVKLAVYGYYDPKEKKVVGHANVLHITLKDDNDPKSEKTTFVVDFTYNTSRQDLGLKPEDVLPENKTLKEKLLEYLNEGREKKERIKPEFLELLFYNGFVGSEAYYYEMKGASVLREGEYGKAIEQLTSAIEMAKKNDLYYGDAILYRAEAYYFLMREKGDEVKELNDAGKYDEANEEFKLVKDYHALFKDDLNKGVGLADLSSFALNEGAKLLYEVDTRESLRQAEKMIRKAIEKAPYNKEYEKTLEKIIAREKELE